MVKKTKVLKNMNVEDRKKEAEKPIYLFRY